MICENCEGIHEGNYGTGRFCSSKCARGFSTKKKRVEINTKVSEKLKGRATEGSKAFKRPEVEARRKAAHAARFSSVERALRKKITQEPKAFVDLGRSLKKKIIIEEQGGGCNRCRLSEWLGKPLVLELEHKDGDSQNDERENLECLCPNCHSLTATWRGRNVPLRKKISDEEMIAVLTKTGSMHKTLLHFGMAPKGGNYKRTKRLVVENNIDLFASNTRRIWIMTDDEVTSAKTMRESGMSLRKIAAAMGYARETITRALER